MQKYIVSLDDTVRVEEEEKEEGEERRGERAAAAAAAVDNRYSIYTLIVFY